MDWTCDGCQYFGKLPLYCIWGCPEEKEKLKVEKRMIDIKKLYYLAHPCTTGNQTVDQNRMDEKLAYYELCAKYPGIKIVRPLDLIPVGTGHHDAMQKCFKLLDACDAAIFAGAWMTSKGCMQEFEFCKDNEIGIIELGNVVKGMAV